MEWKSGEFKEKLGHASILHDITLDNPDLAMAIDLESNDLENYHEEVINESKKHPLVIAEMVASESHIPTNVDNIIANHHEKPEQTGFPRQLSSNRISQLEGVFNVAHGFVNELYRTNFDEASYPQIIEDMKKRFDTGNYREAIKGLSAQFNI